MTDKEFYEKRETMKELWKQLIYDGEPQNYDVSNTGKIRNHTTQKEYKLSKVPGMNNTYEFYNIVLNNGKKRNIGIHRLMAYMFIPIPKKYLKKGLTDKNLVVDHIDNIKYHNIIGNLQWLTQAENTYKWVMSNNTLNDLCIDYETINKVCKDFVKGMTIYEVSKKYNITETLANDIRFGNRYKDISKKYTFPTVQITEEDAKRICEELAKGKSAKKVSEELGYTYATVMHILIRHSWTQVSKDYIFPNTKTTDDVARLICELLQDGKTPKEISEELDVSKKVVEKIRRGETFKHISKDYVFKYDKCKIPDKVIHTVCEEIASGKYLLTEISERNNVSYSFVKNLKARKYREDITSLYKW